MLKLVLPDGHHVVRQALAERRHQQRRIDLRLVVQFRLKPRSRPAIRVIDPQAVRPAVHVG